MKTQPMKNSRKRLSFAAATAVLGVVISGNAMAAETKNASGLLDLNSNGQPRLSTQTCDAFFNAQATGSSNNFPVAFRLFRNGVVVAANGSTSFFQANINGAGTYQLVAVNNNPTRPADITLMLICN